MSCTFNHHIGASHLNHHLLEIPIFHQCFQQPSLHPTFVPQLSLKTLFLSFVEPRVTSSDVLFCPTNSQKPNKNIQFIKQEKAENLETENNSCFSLKENHLIHCFSIAESTNCFTASKNT